MSPLAPPRFETGPALQVAGIRRHHRFADAHRTLVSQWSEQRALGPLPGQRGATEYGVVCGAQAGAFEYLSGVEVDTFEGLPAGVGRVRIPVQRYAVFTHLGGTGTLRETWEAIWSDWLPRSGCTPAPTPDFEVYGARFDARSGTGVVEIWFPVRGGPPGGG